MPMLLLKALNGEVLFINFNPSWVFTLCFSGHNVIYFIDSYSSVPSGTVSGPLCLIMHFIFFFFN